MNKNQQFKKLLSQQNSFILPGAFDAMSALVIEQAGYEAIYATGAGISNAHLGWADVGLTTMHEVLNVVSKMVDVTNVPIIVDGDTGFGNAINVIRSVKEFEKIGVSGIQLEDQVSPKKCGHFNGQEVISKNEMIGKIKAAVDTRVNEDFTIIARTDAISVNGIEDAIDRAISYYEAGASVIFVEAPTNVEDIIKIPKNLPNIPLVLNLVEGGKTPLFTLSEVENMGYKVMLCANTALRAAIKGIATSVSLLKESQSQQEVLPHICSWEERQGLFRLDVIKELEKRYATAD